jgi:NAD(P)-dependent dehydrogenase (short-subunit alcohol dehydrogenase family)
MPTDFSGRIALVTGGSRGLGRALVEELLARDVAKVYSGSRSAHTHPDPRVIPIVLDVTDPAQVAAAAAQADDIDLLINNAGVAAVSPVLNPDLGDLRTNLETNLIGLISVTRAFAPVLGEHDSSSLLNILSVVSWWSALGSYAVSKAAALSATDAIRLELAEQGTTVTALHVGLMETDMAKGIDGPKVDPVDVARLALDGVAAGDLEVLADDRSHEVKASLAGPVAERYPQLVAA